MQCLHFATHKICSYYDDFKYHQKMLVEKLLSKRYHPKVTDKFFPEVPCEITESRHEIWWKSF